MNYKLYWRMIWHAQPPFDQANVIDDLQANVGDTCMTELMLEMNE